MSFARDPATHEYYERRAREYDEWYDETGLFADRDRPGWGDERDEVLALLARLPQARTLDVACGTAYLSRRLRGLVVGIDQSPGMIEIAQGRLPDGLALTADALATPFPDGAFDRVLTGHFFGHLVPEERDAFLAESRRLAPELVVVDSALRPGVEPEAWQERTLNDGSRHRVYKRYLAPDQLADEIGGEPLFGGRWFVVARATVA